MTHLRHCAFGKLRARKDKRTVTEVIKRPMLNSRTIPDHLKMADNVIPQFSPKLQTILLKLGSLNIPRPRVLDDL